MSLLKHIALISFNISAYAFALNENPMSIWDFVVVIEKPKTNIVSLMILKDSDNLFDDKKLMNELRSRFSKENVNINSAWLYSVSFKNGKRSESVGPIDNHLVVSMRSLLNYQLPAEFERQKKKNEAITK